MKRLIGICVFAILAAGLTGCAGLTDALKSVPGQDQSASIQTQGLAAQKETVEKVVSGLANLSNQASLEAIDPDKPITIANGRLTFRTLDSRAYDMLVKLLDFSVYKDPPGFWTWLIGLTDKGMNAAERIAPWYFVNDMFKNQSGSSPSTTYNNQGDVLSINGSSNQFSQYRINDAFKSGGGYSPVGGNLGSGTLSGGTWTYSPSGSQ